MPSVYHTPGDQTQFINMDLISHVTRACIAALAEAAGSTVSACSTVSLSVAKCDAPVPVTTAASVTTPTPAGDIVYLCMKFVD